jgi:predicted nucleic acid-binding protein
MIPIDERTLKDAAKLTTASGVSYDCVHAASMHNKGLDTIITEDATDWKKNKKKLQNHPTPRIQKNS